MDLREVIHELLFQSQISYICQCAIYQIFGYHCDIPAHIQVKSLKKLNHPNVVKLKEVIRLLKKIILSHQVDYKNIENYHSQSLSYFGFSGKTIGSILFLSTSR